MYTMRRNGNNITITIDNLNFKVDNEDIVTHFNNLDNINESMAVNFLQNYTEVDPIIVFPRYLDEMFVTSLDDRTILCVNESVYTYNKLSEEDLSAIQQMVKDKAFGLALFKLNSVSSLISEGNTLTPMDNVSRLRTVKRMLESLSHNIYIGTPLTESYITSVKGGDSTLSIMESEGRVFRSHLTNNIGKKVVFEDWSRNLDMKNLGNTKIVSILREGDLTKINAQQGNEEYAVYLNISEKVHNQIKNTLEQVGPEFSRLMWDAVGKSKVVEYHRVSPMSLEEAQSLAGGPYAITDIQAGDDGVVYLTLVTKADRKNEYKTSVRIDPEVIQEFGSLQDYLEPYTDELNTMKKENDMDYAIKKSAEIISDLSADAVKNGWGKRVSTGNQNNAYVKVNTQLDQVVPIEIDYVFVPKNSDDPDAKDGADGVGRIVSNAANLEVADREGNTYTIRYTLHPDVLEVEDIEDWVDEYDLEISKIRDIKDFDEAYEKSRQILKYMALDATPGRKHPSKNGEKVIWTAKEEEGFQVSDVPPKEDYLKLIKPVNEMTQFSFEELDVEPYLIELFQRGFEPDELGYLSRSGKYLIREGDSLKLRNYSQLWDSEGNPVDKNIDIVSIRD